MTLHTPYPRPVSSQRTGTSFVSATLRLSDPSSDVLVRHVRLLRDCVAVAQRRWNFEVEAAAILPHEMHIFCQFRDDEFAIGGALKLIQTTFARHLPVPKSDVWADTSELVEIAHPVVQLRRRYIENAPVRAGLVKAAADWPYSSIHRTTAQSRTLGVNVA